VEVDDIIDVEVDDITLEVDVIMVEFEYIVVSGAILVVVVDDLLVEEAESVFSILVCKLSDAVSAFVEVVESAFTVLSVVVKDIFAGFLVVVVPATAGFKVEDDGTCIFLTSVVYFVLSASFVETEATKTAPLFVIAASGCELTVPSAPATTPLSPPTTPVSESDPCGSATFSFPGEDSSFVLSEGSEDLESKFSATEPPAASADASSELERGSSLLDASTGESFPASGTEDPPGSTSGSSALVPGELPFLSALALPPPSGEAELLSSLGLAPNGTFYIKLKRVVEIHYQVTKILNWQILRILIVAKNL